MNSILQIIMEAVAKFIFDILIYDIIGGFFRLIKKGCLFIKRKILGTSKEDSMNHQEMNLNIYYDLPTEVWESKVVELYIEMDGWIGFADEEANDRKNLPHWFSFDENKKHVCASVEPSGLHFTGLMDDRAWADWKKKIKEMATQKLGFKVGEIELGEV